jgi:branched-chain amino acid transport system substrate-binding protein
VVLAIKQSGADIMASYCTFENDQAIFARQLRQLGVNLPWVGSPTTVAATTLKLAGSALYGTFAVADYAEESCDGARAFATLFRAASNGAAPDFRSAWTYDALSVLCAAINKAGTIDPGKIREAILSTRGYQGAEGDYNFEQNGDGLHGYNIVRNDNGTVTFDKHIEFLT